MSRYFVPLTQAQPKNAMLDFSPVNQGLNAIGEAKQTATRNAMLQQQMDMTKEQHDWTRNRTEKQDARTEMEWYGKAAMAVDRMKKGSPERNAAFQRILQRHGGQGLTPEEMSPDTGPAMLAAQAGMSIDPLEAEEKRLGIDYKRAQIAKLGRESSGEGNAPSNVREWEHFSKLSPEDQQRYLTMKRAEKYLDTGTGFVRPNPVAPGAAPVPVVCEAVAGKTAEIAEGEALGEAKANLPKAIETAGEMLNQVKSLRTDEYLQNMVGSLAGRTPDVTANAGRVVAKMDQIKGSTFLSAYERLKGGGQITEVEGKKAEEAIARLSRTQSDADYKAALNDLEKVIQNGLTRARVMAGELPQDALSRLYDVGGSASAPSSGGWSIKRID